MDYGYFCKILKGELSELPLNRKERFYTGTVLPALLFHNGLNNFYTFLQTIKGFPPEINEAETKDNFLFYTEYNLKQSAGKGKNVGRIIPTGTNETPDVLIEILEPKKVFIIIEAKMFHNVSQSSLSSQISRQRKAVIEPLKKAFQLEEGRIFHVALVPRMSQCKDGRYFQVINWGIFIGSGKFDLKNNYFYNYLKFALDNYKDLVAKKSGTAKTVEGYMTGAEVYQRGRTGESFWVGRGKKDGKVTGGKDGIIEEIKSNRWYREKYPVNFTFLDPPTRNWISVKEFIELVDKHGKQAQRRNRGMVS